MMVAVIGIGTVLLLVLAVLAFRDNGEHEDAAPETAAIVQQI